MLREINTHRSKDNELSRRWFTDDMMDLFVWINEEGVISKFQLSYDNNYSKHALTWGERSGFQHNKIDDGEGRAGKHKSTPILVPDGEINSGLILQIFKTNSKDIDINIHEFILKKIQSLNNAQEI